MMESQEAGFHAAVVRTMGRCGPMAARRDDRGGAGTPYRRVMPHGRAWAGQSTILMVAMALALLAFVGLLYDAGNVVAARRELQNAADSAARAGADALDERNYRRLEGQGSDAYGFGKGIAEATARQYLAAQGITDGEVDAGGRAVIVRVRRTVPTILLRGFDGAGFTVGASAAAEPIVR